MHLMLIFFSFFYIYNENLIVKPIASCFFLYPDTTGLQKYSPHKYNPMFGSVMLSITYKFSFDKLKQHFHKFFVQNTKINCSQVTTLSFQYNWLLEKIH